MLYFKSIWTSLENDNKRIVTYSELDDERWETRRLDMHSDGQIGVATRDFESMTPDTGLAEMSYPEDLQEIKDCSDELETYEIEAITIDDFEPLWREYALPLLEREGRHFRDGQLIDD